MIYSPKATDTSLEYNVNVEEKDYVVSIEPCGQLDDKDTSIERLNFLGRFK